MCKLRLIICKLKSVFGQFGNETPMLQIVKMSLQILAGTATKGQKLPDGNHQAGVGGSSRSIAWRQARQASSNDRPKNSRIRAQLSTSVRDSSTINRWRRSTSDSVDNSGAYMNSSRATT